MSAQHDKAGQRAVRKLHAALRTTAQALSTAELRAAMDALHCATRPEGLPPHVHEMRWGLKALLHEVGSTRADWPAHAEPAAPVEVPAPPLPPAPDDGFAWLPWTGGACPVAGNTPVLICTRSGHVLSPHPAGVLDWGRPKTPREGDIVWYRASAASKQGVELPPADDGLVWLPWSGGACPVEPNDKVVIILRGGAKRPADVAGRWRWEYRATQNQGDIVLWALVPQPRATPGWNCWTTVPGRRPAQPGPVSDSQLVQVRFRDGTTDTDRASAYSWYWDQSGTDVVHWRLA